MPSARERCRAKLNLFLAVRGRRPDGYHQLLTVFHEVELADEVEATATAAPGVVRFSLAPPASDVPADESNLAARAARALLERLPGAGLDVSLTKRIPVGAGLGGGSADAAGVLRAGVRAAGAALTANDLREIALPLGSDVPFLVEGGSALAEGRGEQLRAVPARPVEFALLVPAFPLSTAAVYSALPSPLPPTADPGPTLAALQAGDADALGRACSNALLPAAEAIEPRMREVLEAARRTFGPRVHLTGSGSALFVPLRRGEELPATEPIPHLRAVLRTRSRT